MEKIIVLGFVFLFGIIIGSFLNVCIYRIPMNVSVAEGRSNCMSCNTTIKWYDLIPIISFILLRGRCRACKSKISSQYPIVEAVNGFFYIAVFLINGWNDMSVVLLNIIYCLAISTLIVLSVIDMRTYTMPNVLNVALLLLGLLVVLIEYFGRGRSMDTLIKHGIGLFAVSVILYIIFYASKGRGIGGGDVKLMAGAGVLLGWEVVILAFILGCILASVIHTIKVLLKISNRMLAFGPYLSAGIVIGILFGENMIRWYINLLLY